MILNTRSFRTLIIAAIAVFSVVSMATAQLRFTNPPCAGVTVNNTTAAAVGLTFVTIPAGTWPTFVLPAGAAVLLPVPAGGVTVRGLRSCTGALVVFNPPPTPIACGPGAWWIQSIALPPTCLCFDVCADPLACTINIQGGTAPPCVHP